MEKEKKEIVLPEGNFEVDIISYSLKDKQKFYKIYNLWIKLSKLLKFVGGRGINLPEGLSEGVFCISMNCVKLISNIQKANTSFDCYDLKRKKRIQVKACSVLPDLTSFGPKSIWDEIYFIDFYKDGSFKGKYDIYKIDNKDIYNHKVNENQTLKDQQLQGRRPRFSIYKEIILKKNLKPIKSDDLSKK